MSRWTLTPPLPGEDPLNALMRLTHDHNLILSDLEQLELQLRGDGGYTSKLSGTLDAQGHSITNLAPSPRADGDALSLKFLKSGRTLYTEDDTFKTDRRIQHPAGVDGTDSVNLAQLQALFNKALAALIPTGIIVAWYGAVADVPTGWTLCDGSVGTPDLRGRFIPGAGGAYAVGATGGADTLNLAHAHTADGTLGTDSISAGTPAGTVAAIGVTGSATVQRDTTAGSLDDTASQVHTHPAPVFTGSALAGHVHDVAGSTDSQLSAATENRPAYYALCYIMKT